jgi:hypothetical protein
MEVEALSEPHGNLMESLRGSPLAMNMADGLQLK